MRRFFLEREKILSERPKLTGPDFKHVRTVLRLKPGDELFLFDGKGSEYRARIIESTPKAIILSVEEAFPSTSESPARITIGQGLLKAGKMDGVVRQATELGIHALIPVIAERSVPKPKSERWAEKERRWKTIAWESLKQCGRSQTPRLAPPISFEALVHASEAYSRTIIFHDDDSEPASTLRPEEAKDAGKVLALIGPEGGFSPDEIQMAVNFGFQCTSLGPRILKADTAMVAACTILQYLFGDLRQPPEKP
ncbi:MAG: 16S rRNA (uracil(1498)-N(3))-methyltransferase [Deltaproteobacteria bacterium]|nr:16S rRNA (uracil(1498)-N(3))-methyltransferase [Deltaproteobacteria bacterium]MBW2260180.1 16S rRNA (uracil(1498)-N(3))-methyltransferase [Deltaproteobacteria bacterium]